MKNNWNFNELRKSCLILCLLSSVSIIHAQSNRYTEDGDKLVEMNTIVSLKGDDGTQSSETEKSRVLKTHGSMSLITISSGTKNIIATKDIEIVFLGSDSEGLRSWEVSGPAPTYFKFDLKEERDPNANKQGTKMTSVKASGPIEYRKASGFINDENGKYERVKHGPKTYYATLDLADVVVPRKIIAYQGGLDFNISVEDATMKVMREGKPDRTIVNIKLSHLPADKDKSQPSEWHVSGDGVFLKLVTMPHWKAENTETDAVRVTVKSEYTAADGSSYNGSLESAGEGVFNFVD